jgi:hypothetical protein
MRLAGILFLVLAAAQVRTLQDGTPVRLRLNRTVSSANAHVGETVDFEITEFERTGASEAALDFHFRDAGKATVPASEILPPSWVSIPLHAAPRVSFQFEDLW